jgi:hypothetical protein
LEILNYIVLNTFTDITKVNELAKFTVKTMGEEEKGEKGGTTV